MGGAEVLFDLVRPRPLGIFFTDLNDFLIEAPRLPSLSFLRCVGWPNTSSRTAKVGWPLLERRFAALCNMRRGRCPEASVADFAGGNEGIGESEGDGYPILRQDVFQPRQSCTL